MLCILRFFLHNPRETSRTEANFFITPLLFFFRYYGLRKISTPSSVAKALKTSTATASDGCSKQQQPMSIRSSNSRPIITVTEFTPGNTPDKVGHVCVKSSSYFFLSECVREEVLSYDVRRKNSFSGPFFLALSFSG